jgi:hypothetical protein
MADGVKLINAVQDVYLDKKVTIANTRIPLRQTGEMRFSLFLQISSCGNHGSFYPSTAVNLL